MSARDLHLATRCVHAGKFADQHGSPFTPLYDATTFEFDSTADLLAVIDGRSAGSLYTRYGMNPTIRSLEEKLAALDQAEEALVFTSGMAAISALFLTYGRDGIVCIGDAYGGTLELLSRQLPSLGFKTRLILLHELELLHSAAVDGARLVFFETPTNPKLEIIDIWKVAEIAHGLGALVVVDNTFATQINQLPLSLGADLVVYSATKYLSGHSDITAGAVVGPRKLLDPVRAWRKNLGQVPAPITSHLLARSLRTLAVRVERHNANAQIIAEWLARHPRVRRVMYPGLPDFEYHELAATQMSGFGGMVTFELDGSGEDAMKVVDKLRLFTLAPSLGGVESLVTQPVATSHRNLSQEEQIRRGISEAMIRLSIGLEDPEDLLEDLDQALA
jgi:cystathionine beta-lyase/cystathionine gamma-synthase